MNTAGKAIDVTSHNIANSSTVGYKAANAHFADVYASSLAGGGASQIGIGTSLAAVQQPGRGQNENPGADRNYPAASRMGGDQRFA